MQEGTFLGFDFGTKFLGIAVGQSLTKTARPLITLSVGKGINYDQLTQIIETWLPQGLVVGLALQEAGEHSPTSRKAMKFGQKLAAYFNLPVYYIEERLTSVAARARIKESFCVEAIEKDLDAVAAAIILESWLTA
ncbi:MAG: Holliday junction resolvase RuvX [Proteobacteria bacterium]|nr:Holliday junction resolvase RuvX [Pseudomonadota bacterium]